MGEAKRKATATARVSPASGDEAVDRLRRQFESLGIVVDDIAFYDSPAFMAAERTNPEILKAYAEWVMVRPRSPDYDARVRTVVPKVAGIVGHRLRAEQIYGNCLNTAGGLARMLDRLGVWSFVVRGSTNIQDLDHPELGARYWWDIDKVDHPNGITGHAWVCAPPYMIVDVALKNQPWGGEHFGDLLPEAILIDSGTRITPRADDVVCHDVQAYHAYRQRRRDPNIHHRLKPDLAWMVRNIGAWEADIGRARLRCVPSAITATEEDLEGIDESTGLRVRAIDIWNDEVKPAFER